MSNAGKLIPVVLEIQWKISKFSLLSKAQNSASFSFAGASWFLRIYPNGRDKKNAEYVCIFLHRKYAGIPITLEYTFGLVTADGNKANEVSGSKNYNKVIGSGYTTWIQKSYILDEKAKLLPSDTLTVFCTLTYSTSTVDENKIEECSYCGKTFDAEKISSHEKKCMERPIKCPECSEVVLLEEWNDHECQDSVEDDGSLRQDLKKVLLDGLNHDLILKVSDKELRAHQDILRSRSPVFASMLNHDMKEKNSGVIDIPDCDPEAMEQFLSYIYTGFFKTTENSVLKLYYIADKYSVNGLKEECCAFIKKSLSPTNICSVIQTALKHNNSSLLEYTTEYFINNVLDIMKTVEWQTFMKDNSTVANELTIKSIEKFKNV